MMKKQHLGSSACIAVCAALFYTVLVPLQTFLANRDLFSFTTADVIVEALPWLGVGALGVFCLLAMASFVLGRVLHVLLFAILLCGYLEIGVLSVGLPPFNAAVRMFQNPFRGIIDTAMLGFVVALSMLLYRWLKSYAHWAALAVVVLAISSLFDVSKKTDGASGPLSAGQCPNYDVLMSARLSPERNVIVMILDSTPASITTRLMREDSGLCAKFAGFTCFENNRAMHEMSDRGVPGLLTGKYLEKDVSAHDYEMSVFGPDSFLLPYAERECPVYWISGMMGVDGFTNRRLGNFSNAGKGLVQTGPVFFRNSVETPYVSLMDTVRFRLAPYRYKSGILGEAIARSMRSCVWENYGDESFACHTLLKARFLSETNTSLVAFHTHGTHGPITRDRCGKALPSPTHDPAAFSEYAIFLFRQIASFMDGLREKDVYDKSLIILCADHGSIELRSGDGTAGHGADDSILWVKPIGSSSPFSFSQTPTSNCRIADLVKASVNRDLSASDVADLLHATDRKFRAKFGRAWWSAGRSPYFYEWRYDDAGRVISCQNLGIFKAN